MALNRMSEEMAIALVHVGYTDKKLDAAIDNIADARVSSVTLLWRASS